MNNNQQTQEEGGLEVVGMALLLGAIALGACLWMGAQLASLISGQGLLGWDSATVAESLIGTVTDHLGDPAQAWPEPQRSQLPPAWLYWSSTVAAVIASIGIGERLWRVFRFDQGNLDETTRLGVKKHAELASRSDYRKFKIDEPTEGRFLLGKVGRMILASERSGFRRKMRQIAGAIAILGPSQSGKSTHAMEALAWWKGPAIVVSVKPDLALQTIEQRALFGKVKVFDPAAIHQDKGRVGTWNPLDNATTWVDAQRMAKRLIEATGNNESPTGRFWSNNSVAMLAAFMWLAAATCKPMKDVAHWVVSMDQPTDDGPGEVASYIKTIGKIEGIDQERVDEISAILRGVWASDSRMKSSYFVSLKAAVEAWSRHSVAEATQTTTIDLDWLINSNNTIYITAPLVDQQLLAPVIGGFVATLVDEIMLLNQTTGQKADPEVLLLLDETANMPLPQLPAWASTLTGLGVQLVTVWQSFSQIRNSYGENANTILDNSRSTLWFSGIKDIESIRYVEKLLGNEYQESRISSFPERNRGGVNNDALVPPNVLRQMEPGDRLIITGNSPAIHAQPIRQPKTRRDRFRSAW